jgi:dTDP-4-amino-4,6-dideoxygalactose transaminase
VAAVVASGAAPVFCDVDPETHALEPSEIDRHVTRRTRAVLVVHLYGHPAPMPAILERARAHGLKVLEDCAQAHGARLGGRRVGTFGDAAAFSFYPTKNLGALGDAGAVLTADPLVAEQARLLRMYGWRRRYVSELHSTVSRLDELQAAALRVFLRHLDEWTRLRREAAARYADLGLGQLCDLPADEPGHVYHLFVCRSPDRDRIRAALQDAGVGTGVYYATPLHLQPALRYLAYEPGSLPETERAARENFSVPLWAGIETRTQERVVDVVREATAVAAR